MKILDIKIDNLTRLEILGKVKSALSKEAGGLQIATVNPEFILKAQENQEFKNILNSKDTLCVADGVGLKFSAWRQGETLKCRWAGIDLMWEVLRTAEKKKKKVFLIGNGKGLSSWWETVREIKKKYPKIEIGGIDVEVFDRKNGILELRLGDLQKGNTESYKFIRKIFNPYLKSYEPDIIFCALGAPVQEILLSHLQDSVQLVMGVGGSFDFIAGKIKRAPKFFRVIGLEWLWRLLQEPHYRFKKIWNAVIIFPIKVLFTR